MGHTAADRERERRVRDVVPLWQRRLPGLAVLLHYQRGWLGPDLLAGLTVAAYLIPQVMAYAEVAGLPAVVGLWATIPALLVYAVLGSSRQLSVGPESTTSLMTAVAVGALIESQGRENYAATAAVLAIAVGLVCVLGFVARLGFLADLLSRPVLVGYMAGIAVLMIVSQLGKITGTSPEGSTVVGEVAWLARHLGQVHAPTLILATAVVIALFALRHWTPRLPGPLIVMLAAAAVVAVAHLERLGVGVIGAVPSGLPAPRIPDVGAVDLGPLALAALGVALVGYSDNVLTARAFAAKQRQKVDADQEFLALGAANLASGLFQGFPVSSSGSRTVLGDAMGSRTQLYSLAALVTVVITMFFLHPVLGAFPTAALGGVVVYAAIRLVDVGEFRRIARFRRSEFVIALATTVSVVFFDVLVGIGVAVALSILDLLRRITHPHDGILGYVPGMAGMHDIDDYPGTEQVPGLLVYRYDSPLVFANAEDFLHRALVSVDSADRPISWFLLNAEANTVIDLTAVDALESLRATLADRGIVLALARVKQDVADQLARAGLVDKIGPDRIFATLPTAVQGYRDWSRQATGTEIPGEP